MGIFRGSTPQILQDLGVSGIEYQVTLTLTPEQMRSLSTVPVDLVVPANANTLLIPQQLLFVGAEGTEAYSTNPGPRLQYTGDPGGLGFTVDADSWDGSAIAVSYTFDAIKVMGTNTAPLDIASGGAFGSSLVGLALQLTAENAVTDGDASCAVILTYMSYDLTGLL